jgi:cellulose synthase/poly-beta-1,6-N-acetylglucosamine synthase-like glycosyltransferase
MLAYYKVHLLIGFLVVFVLLPSLLIKTKSRAYKTPYTGSPLDVTVVVPVHLEDADVFEKCLDSISRQNPKQLIVSMDDCSQEITDIAKRYGAEIVSHPHRVGKRQALADAWLRAKYDIVVQVDSDVILREGCLEEISKPFSNPEIVGVSTFHTTQKRGSKLAYVLSSLIEENRNINDKAFNGGLVVCDGRCNAWRLSFLMSVRNKLLNDYWLGVKGEIGDDRFLNREALKRGFKTAHQETAKIYTLTPKTFKDFVRQQIRWRRSGTKFWMKDLVEGVRPSKTYAFKCAMYYTAPFVFLLAIVLDMIFFRLPASLVPATLLWSISKQQWFWELSTKFWEMTRISIPNWQDYWVPLWQRSEVASFLWVSLIVLAIGCTLVTLVRQLIYFGKTLFPSYLILQGLLGLFVMLPVSIYGALTVKNQGQWLTRASGSERGSSNKGDCLVIGMLALVSCGWFVYAIWHETYGYGC